MPWAAKASFTRPYHLNTTTVHGKRAEVPHVVAVPVRALKATLPPRIARRGESRDVAY